MGVMALTIAAAATLLGRPTKARRPPRHPSGWTPINLSEAPAGFLNGTLGECVP
jgi:hypothetical protein